LVEASRGQCSLGKPKKASTSSSASSKGIPMVVSIS
jgi:hypothetical protein